MGSAYRIILTIRDRSNWQSPVKTQPFYQMFRSEKFRRFVLFTTRNRTFKLQLMEHLLTETLLVGRIRLKFDAIRLPGDSFCRLSAGAVSENLWNSPVGKVTRIYSCDRRNVIYDACGVYKIDYCKNVEDCTSLFVKQYIFYNRIGE